MATSNMKVIVNRGGTRKMLLYLLNPSKEHAKSARIVEPESERVQFIYSTYLNDISDIKNLVKEILLSKGRKAESVHFRISFSPDDRKLGPLEIQQFCNEIMKRYLPGRNFIAVTHNDCEHQHIHILADYLDTDGRALNFKKHFAGEEAKRRQSAVDQVCELMNLNTVQREPERFKRAEKRINKRQMREMKYSWKLDLISKIEEALKISRNHKDFQAALNLMGIDARFRGKGISYKFIDKNGKKRIIRGQRLGEKYSFTPIELDNILQHLDKCKVKAEQQDIPPKKEEKAAPSPDSPFSFSRGGR